VNTWNVARESAEWCGPIVCTFTDSTGQPVAAGVVEFAVLPRDTRPLETDWQAPYVDPDGSGAFGVWLAPVTGYTRLGIWARDTDNPEAPVLEPSDVGYVTRT
jgi:hypothetical protein